MVVHTRVDAIASDDVASDDVALDDVASDDVASDDVALDDIASRVQVALSGGALVVHPTIGDRAGELAAVAFAVMRGVRHVVTDSPSATVQVVAVIEAFIGTEASPR
jgi:hypothetical protein